MTLRCVSDAKVNGSYITWHGYTQCGHYDVTTCASSIDIYNGYSRIYNQQKFDVIKVNNATHVTRDLIIKAAQLTDAGVYRCDEHVPAVIGSRQSANAQLIVLGNY